MKIWGTSYGLIGDLVMSLPILTYFEKKYPESYKYFVIQKKCSQAASLFIDHPLIDKIIITENWDSFGDRELKLFNSCTIRTPLGQKHDNPQWFNERNQVLETARLAGILDLGDVLTEDELFPKLNKWFPIGEVTKENQGYSKVFNNVHLNNNDNTIAIWPFANYGVINGRSPNKIWWENTVNTLIDSGYLVNHFGYINEPTLSQHKNYNNNTNFSFFEQVRRALASKVCIGTDSGSMWVMSAYSHPSINLITKWIRGHTKNTLALAPFNKNSVNICADNLSNIPINRIMDSI